MDTCGQKSGYFLAREWRLVDKRAETCGLESRDLWTIELRLVGKRVETCGNFTARCTSPLSHS